MVLNGRTFTVWEFPHHKACLVITSPGEVKDDEYVVASIAQLLNGPGAVAAWSEDKWSEDVGGLSRVLRMKPRH